MHFINMQIPTGIRELRIIAATLSYCIFRIYTGLYIES